MLLPANVVNWAVHCLSYRPELPVAHLISFAPVLSKVLLSPVTKDKRVWSILARSRSLGFSHFCLAKV